MKPLNHSKKKKKKRNVPIFDSFDYEISSAMNMDDPEIKAFNVFNIHADVTNSEVLTSVIMKDNFSSMRTLIWQKMKLPKSEID